MRNLFGETRDELRDFCASLGQPAYRGDQLARWMYVRGARDWKSMTDLPAGFRLALSEQAEIARSRVLRVSESRDGTRKFLLGLADGSAVESVLLPYTDRVTVCVSSQVGCPAGCVFCATGVQGFVRNLSAGEVVDQVLTLQEHAGRRVTNVVYMGMGEPLLNYRAVLRSVRLVNAEVGIAMRHLAISTVGVVPQIRKLAAENLQLTLAVSLHAPDDELRARLMPITRKYRIADLMAVCREYVDKTHRRVTFEYLLLGGVNDTADSAKRLAGLLKGMLCNVNLIPYNEVLGFEFRRPEKEAIRRFRSILEESGIETTQRLERGHAIAAACGQLKSADVA